MDEQLGWWLLFIIPLTLFIWGIFTGIWHARQRRVKAWTSTALGVLLAGVPIAYLAEILYHDMVSPSAETEVFDQGFGFSRSYLAVTTSYVEPFEETLKAARKGDIEAQERLGDDYAKGEAGASRNVEEAIRWYTLAANRGSYHARLRLAELYDSGEGGKQNHAASMHWYEVLAKAGDVQSQGYLGYRYGTGDRAPKDLNKAAYWLEKAALGQERQSQYYMARMYELGQGRKQDKVEALAWYLLANDGADKKPGEGQQRLRLSMDASEQARSFQLAATRLATFAQAREKSKTAR